MSEDASELLKKEFESLKETAKREYEEARQQLEKTLNYQAGQTQPESVQVLLLSQICSLLIAMQFALADIRAKEALVLLSFIGIRDTIKQPPPFGINTTTQTEQIARDVHRIEYLLTNRS